MITEQHLEIDAPATVVWRVYTDVEHWPDWTASITAVEPLDSAELAIGRRYVITQPRFPRLVWAVTRLEAGTSWTWEQRSFGGVTIADHIVEAIGAERTRVTQRLEQRGPIGSTVGRLTRGLTRRYLDMEARGLSTAAQAAHRSDAAG